ncbi:MAG: Ger(x)C family spore germination protein, partial [Tumebacillaceae bacterium]
VLLLTTIACSGCWDRKELEQRTSVVALGIDKVNRGKNEQPLIKISVQIPIPIKIMGSGGGAGGEGGKSAVKIMTSTGYSMADAMKQLQNRLNQELFYGHTRVIAVSETVARNDMSGIIDTMRRSPQMRRLLWLVITKGDAEGLLQADPKLEQIPIVYVMDMMENGAKQGRIPMISLGKWFIDRSSSGIEPTANYVETSKKEIKWEGLSVFHNDQMVGTISEQESWVLLQVRDRKIGGNVTIPCPGSPSPKGGSRYITVHPKKVHVKETIEPYGKTFRLRFNVLVEDDVIESMCNLDYTKEDNYKTVEKALAEEMNKRAVTLIDNVQKKFRTDIFGMGNKLRAKYLDAFESMDWNKEFPNAKIEIQYEVRVRRVGMKLQ